MMLWQCTFSKTKLIDFLKVKFRNINKITYFSDGCAAQYKNCKNFVNLCHHRSDYGISAEWHFFATSHGKGPCDGIGGTVKHNATRASIQRPNDKLILTPRQFYDCVWGHHNDIIRVHNHKRARRASTTHLGTARDCKNCARYVHT